VPPRATCVILALIVAESSVSLTQGAWNCVAFKNSFLSVRLKSAVWSAFPSDSWASCYILNSVAETCKQISTQAPRRRASLLSV